MQDWGARYGIYFPTVLLGGTVGIVTATTILISYWTWGNGDAHHGVWVHVVTTNWGTRLITLCSTVLRVCVGAQSVLCCMLLATLSLEHGHVLFMDAPAMSMYQYAVPGPYSMTLPLLRGAMYNKRLHNSKKHLGFICLIGLVMVTTVNQFTSTLLISDTTDWNLPGPSEVRPVFYGNLLMPFDGLNALYQKPKEFPTFAETSRNESAFTMLDTTEFKNWKNSGSYIRAMFPLPKNERETLVEYQGPAVVMEAHVQCIAFGPEQYNVSFQYDYFSQPGGLDTVTVSSIGDLPNSTMVNDIALFRMIFDHPISMPAAVVNAEIQRNKYLAEIDATLITNCSLELSPGPDLNSGPYFSETLLCYLKSNTTQFPSYDDGLPIFSLFDTNNVWLLASRVSMNVGTNSSLSDLQRATEKFGKSKSVFNGSEWGKHSAESDNVRFTLDQSLCVTSFPVKNAIINVKRPTGFPEPEMSLIDSGSTKVYNTSDIEQQLRMQTPHQQRGVFELLNWTALELAETLNITSSISGDAWRGANDGRGVQLCGTTSCSSKISSEAGAVFLNTLGNTNDLSQALQSLLTIITITEYNSQLTEFDGSYNATITRMRIYPIPRKLRGLAVLLATLALHFVLLGVLLLLFFRGVKATGKNVASPGLNKVPRTFGQSWMAVAQLGCGAAEGFLKNASKEHDSGMGKRLSITGWKDIIQIVRDEDKTAIYPWENGKQRPKCA